MTFVAYHAAPGVKDAGRLIRIECFQLKYHVGHAGSVSSANLIDPNWTSTKRSLLRRFAESWQELRKNQPEIRLTLVTNWTWLADDTLQALTRDGGMLDDRFLVDGRETAVRVSTVRMKR